MAHLSDEEKEELIASALNIQLKNDFTEMRKRHYEYFKKISPCDLDSYIKFLTSTNAFANHAKKPLKLIDGDNFKL